MSWTVIQLRVDCIAVSMELIHGESEKGCYNSTNNYPHLHCSSQHPSHSPITPFIRRTSDVQHLSPQLEPSPHHFTPSALHTANLGFRGKKIAMDAFQRVPMLGRGWELDHFINWSRIVVFGDCWFIHASDCYRILGGVHVWLCRPHEHVALLCLRWERRRLRLNGFIPRIHAPDSCCGSGKSYKGSGKISRFTTKANEINNHWSISKTKRRRYLSREWCSKRMGRFQPKIFAIYKIEVVSMSVGVDRHCFTAEFSFIFDFDGLSRMGNKPYCRFRAWLECMVFIVVPTKWSLQQTMNIPRSRTIAAAQKSMCRTWK